MITMITSQKHNIKFIITIFFLFKRIFTYLCWNNTTSKNDDLYIF